MTKQFQIIGENYTNINMPVFVVCREEDCCFEVYESKEDAQMVCDKLNNLVDENEQLKRIIDKQELALAEAMTENKRFELCDDGFGIIDNLTKRKCHTLNCILKHWLNPNWEQTQRFEKHNQRLKDENDQLKKVIEEHKNTLKGQSNSIYQLKKENEFLKRRLEEWV